MANVNIMMLVFVKFIAERATLSEWLLFVIACVGSILAATLVVVSGLRGE